ncbi:MAG: NAD(+) kinase [Gammaproteobacteria bacterium]|nr:NAD(+) kinase [Gammaproteobacteria bacterium]
MNSFQCIGLIGKYGDPSVGETLHAVSAYLQSHDLEILLDESTAEVLPDHNLGTASREELGQRCDLVIVIGGDGTMLNAGRSLAAYDSALLGINLGRLGFLTDISPDSMQESLDRILAGEYHTEERFLLHCTTMRDGEHITDTEAFNDVVIHKWNAARLIEVEIHVNNQYVNTLRADGLIVSTPTGSTAYALSGGGPILSPSLDAIVLVPICPHAMSNRPIVIDGNSMIELIIKESTQAQVSCDGQLNLSLQAGDHIHIRKNEHMLRLIHPKPHNHFETLRAKLSWG